MKLLDIILLFAMITVFILGAIFAFLSFQSFDWFFVILSFLFILSGIILNRELKQR